jgi:mRNA-degrading endonuclease toxin of MazEF toxin-antitoxin module
VHIARESDRPRPVVIWQSDTLTNVLQSVLVIPLTTNLERANLAGTALISASEEGLSEDSVALAFQLSQSKIGTPDKDPNALSR